MAAEEGTTTGNQPQSSIKFLPASANVGLDLDSVTAQIKPGELTWALNAVVENYDGQKVNYTNEPSNVSCFTVPSGFQVIGRMTIVEDNMIILWLANPLTGGSEIGKVVNCVYSPIINADCLGLDVDYPVHKAVYYRDNCSLDVFWVDAKNRTRHLDLLNLPYTEEFIGSCDPQISKDIDCNKLNVQPDFHIPQIEIEKVVSGGNTLAGTYQFAVQYANALHEPYTSYYSVTNPVSLFAMRITEDFNYAVDKSIVINITNIDTTGLYDYLNLAVIETVNNISTAKLVGSYSITGPSLRITYSGEVIGNLNVDDIIIKYEVYDKADDLTTSNDVLILDQLTPHERLSYQEIASQITLQWETWRIKGDRPYAKEINVVNTKGYFRDETYPYEFVPLLGNGKQTDGFTIPLREATSGELQVVFNNDTGNIPMPRWKVYNTATVSGFSDGYNINDPKYEGPYQYGEFAYSESSDTYPCNEIYGNLQNKPIRHHRFPDCLVSPHFDKDGYIYPIGVRINVQQVVDLIRNSTLTQQQKDNIRGFKIVRGNRAGNRSIIAKGIINNVLKYKNIGNTTESNASVGGGAEGILISALDYTKKAHVLFVQYSFLSLIGTITVGLNFKKNNRFHDAEDKMEGVINSPSLYTEENVSILQSASSDLEFIIDHPNGDIRGTAYAKAAKTELDAAIQVIQVQMQIIAELGSSNITQYVSDESNKYMYFPNYPYNDVSSNDFLIDNIIMDDSAKLRSVFHSPDTHFYQPAIGDQLKIETLLYGVSSAKAFQVENHSRYQFVNEITYLTALLGGLGVGFASGSYGVANVNVFDGTAAFTAYQAMLSIIYKIVPHRNYAYQMNSTGKYVDTIPVANSGNKIRNIDIGYYLPPGMFNVGDDYTVNNFQRESSVYLKTNLPLPFTSEVSTYKDTSKIMLPIDEIITTPIASYYTSIKNSISNQWGQLYSYGTVDTGYQKIIDVSRIGYGYETIFGGDCFINKFSYKTKLPLFIDNRVFPAGSPAIDDADIAYNEIPNIGKPKYWFSTDVTAKTGLFDTIFGVKSHHMYLDVPKGMYDDGRIVLFVYGIPTFWCESEVNVDLRQAYNTKEGDFYPRVGNGIPDRWLQESQVSINYDNTYWYNKTYSKQNKENFFSHLPPDYTPEDCILQYPYRAIFSEKRTDNPNPSKRNNWLIYKPDSRFDFPQNHGRLISLDGINNSQVLARFENKTLLYNALLTMPTSAAQAYLGQTLFARGVPPLDFADTDLGYIGTQHKFILKTEYGYIVADAVRGQIFILSGQQFEELTSQKYKCQQFFTHNLPFQILRQFPDIDIDNNFNGIGLHGVYDSRFNRMIITKLDYRCINPGVQYKDGKFYLEDKLVSLPETEFFENKSFTVSFDFENMRWISVHSYRPRYYIGNVNTFLQAETNEVFIHHTDYNHFNHFNGILSPYEIEYPVAFKYRDELLQSVQDHTKVLKYTDHQEFIETDGIYFDQAILHNNQQCSGVRKLSPKPKSINSYLKYPIYNTDNINILVTKANNFYQFNTFWSVIRNSTDPIWKSSANSPFKELNQANMNYNKLSYKKAPIVAKDVKVRLTLNTTDEYKLVSQFIVNETKENT